MWKICKMDYNIYFFKTAHIYMYWSYNFLYFSLGFSDIYEFNAYIKVLSYWHIDILYVFLFRLCCIKCNCSIIFSS